MLGAAETEPEINSWEFHRQVFLDNERERPAKARKALLEIIELEDDRSIPFLRELADRDPEPREPYARLDPEFVASFTYRGIAQSGLAALGDEEAWKQLSAESFHPGPSVRFNALSKIQRVPDERAVEALSNFLGDTEGTGYEATPVEWAALFELSKRLNSPPFPVQRFSDLHGFYEGDGREKWLRWRYENYGPIPGREELFAQFMAEEKGRQEPAIHENSESAVAKASGKNATASAETEPDRNIHSRWLWIGGGVVIAVAITFVIRRTRTSAYRDRRQ